MNPFYNQQQGQPGMPFGSPQAMRQQFQQFRSQMQGDPNAILQNLMQSGKVNQQMLNRAQQMANMFGQFLK